MPRVHRVISLLKRWLMGTHQGAVSHKHLDYYLDELRSDSIAGDQSAAVFVKIEQFSVCENGSILNVAWLCPQK